ncbi:bifunctional dihydroorotate dehydrogenase B NAD binding subunit/NADPH-dependent glutamate synthase [Desulfotalea psychrophila]|uniref:Probable glutamate synthase, beta subunit n=1 Tax=Desulfotalea psychrophila (strain LSv54 / DSM 12343) TaxID=177439 RepID=Q6AQL2_DESPS|nr:bifunctional dihydroorotate dehydrogenase B NAD binding subunit/NADPH-dependent glutamate synthase [Desulfotalea psychrophila]CAG35361.1 probable glutamate synthase, beta subunit [Desulfotalea psychrophila LSv54]
MFEIVENSIIAPNVHRLIIKAPRVAKSRKPGQFVIVHEEGGERIPLTIADENIENGTITLIIQAVGEGTKQIVSKQAGEFIRDIAGPLGKASEIEKVGKVVCIGGGVGTAVLFPLAKALAAAGNDLTTIIGGRSESFVILKDELAVFSTQLKITTEDGSLGDKGFVTGPLAEILEDETRRPEIIYAIGPVPMMAAICEQTRPYGVKTIVSLNPIMVDGTGMCGGCRVTVANKVKFACVDGPEFDGHEVDFKELAARQRQYVGHDHDRHKCRMDAVKIETISIKERMAIPRAHMPEQDAKIRATNFTEVNLGISEEVAIREAQRCLNCKTRPCVSGCPVGVRIPEYLQEVAKGDFAAAAKILREDNALPATTGRVCPQESQCEQKCVRGKKGDAVALGWLERFVADWAAQNLKPEVPCIEKTGKKVAIIGSGPGGLTAAGELARRGHDVTVFEALHTAGGVLRYGIPEFRLPKNIVDHEVENLVALGVKFEFNVIIGQTLTIKEIMAEFDSCFIANGAGLPIFLNLPGENLNGVYSSNEYLTRVNLMNAYKKGSATPIVTGPTTVVFGGGNTAMDSARTAKRMGSERVILAYRRGRDEMPARLEEVIHAEQEGIEFMFLVAPLSIGGTEDGWVENVHLQKMELGEPDASGRRRPVAIEGSEFKVEADIVIMSIGTTSNPLLTSTCPELELNKWGNIVVDEKQMSSMQGVFAGGDIVRGGATVILAMGDGKNAAQSIHDYLQK